MSQTSKYRVRIDPPKPTEQEIRASKNFNKVLWQYKRAKRPKPLHGIMGKLNKLLPMIIIVLSLLLFLFYYLQFSKQYEREKAPPTEDAPIGRQYSSVEFGPSTSFFSPQSLKLEKYPFCNGANAKTNQH